ncbi:MAG TPA: family 16 glycoside hydrolase, partial [Planctomycetaceae bacterium]|nr:family 16 glycoside hydrolase [Planctomycetaceae bacterium]
MGVVYLARNKLMDRLEVLKVLSKEMLGKQGRSDRFLREIQSAAKLHHPHVVAAYTAFPLGEMLCFAMEYVEGDDLAKLVRARGPLPVLNACYFAYQTALGLEHAHERGMIHRDIKPGNLILFRQGKKGTVKILDFGLAKVTSEQRIDGTLTQEGQMLGTPDYIAPEQTLDAQKADIRADIYSLGCTLYHLLTGSPPFSGNSLYEVLQAHHSVDARPLNLVRPEVPAELAAVVAKMMAKEPSRRYQSPADVALALKPFLKPGGLMSRQPDLEPGVSLARPSATPIPAAIPMPDDEENPFLAPMPEVEASERWKSLIDTPALGRSSTARSAIRKPLQRPPKWLWPTTAIVGVLLAGLAMAWAIGVFHVKTQDGVIVLQDLPDNAEVLVDGEKVTVRFSEGGGPAEITVPPGKRGVQVKKDGFQAFGNEVSLASGEKKLLSVHLDPLPQKASTKERDEAAPTARTGEEPRIPNSAVTLSPRSLPDNKSMPRDLLVAPFDELAAKDAQKKWAGHLGSPVMITNTTGMHMTLIPPGRFDMGSAETAEKLSQAFPAEAATKRADLEPLGERPMHRVTISKPFYLGIYEVTKRQFKQFVDDTGYRTDAEKDGKGGRGYTEGETWLSTKLDPKFTWRDWGMSQSDDTPVVNVSHNDATAFCLWLANREGNNYRLPTEAEWEYACRAGTTGRYYNADDPEQLTNIANIRDATMKAKFSAMPTAQTTVESSDGYAFPAPVGQFAPNQFGLYDMIGNVSELCADRYDEIYYFRSPPLDPAGPPSGESRVVRGGAWLYGAFLSRIAKRMERRPDDRASFIGFRLALSVDSSAAQGSETPSNSDREPQSTSTAVGSEDGFVPLFNGKDLTGWNKNHSDTIEWTVANETLVGVNRGVSGSGGMLSTERANYADFHLRCETMLAEGRNSAINLRHDQSELQAGAKRNYVVTIRGTDLSTDDNNREPTGTLRIAFERKPLETLQPAADLPIRSGEWFKLEIIAQGKQIRALVNGTTVVDFIDPSSTLRSGSIGLFCRWGSTIRFRNIEIKELSPGAPPESTTNDARSQLQNPTAATPVIDRQDGFVLLFNGKDFAGWTFPYGGAEKWSIEQGILRGEGTSWIVSGRSDYKDFRLRFEVRGSNDINKQVIFRSSDVGGNETNYRFHLGGVRSDGNSTRPPGFFVLKKGGVFDDGTQVTTDGLARLKLHEGPFLEKDQWHPIEVSAVGNIFRMSVDGHEISAFRDQESRLTHGRIAFALVEGARIELRGIEINESPGKNSLVLPKKSPRKPLPSKPRKSAQQFRALFNHKDLSGWVFPYGGQENWIVKDGLLCGRGKSKIVSSSSYFKDFELRLRVRSADAINKHFCFRVSDENGDLKEYHFELGGIRWDMKTTHPIGFFFLKGGGGPS